MDLKKIRLEHNWSQEQLATITGVSARTIQRIENGHPPSLETLKALAAGFGTSVDELRSKVSETEGGSEGSESEEAHLVTPLKQWKSFILHTIIFMGVITWLFILNLFFAFDQEVIGSVGLVWGFILAFHLVKSIRDAPQNK